MNTKTLRCRKCGQMMRLEIAEDCPPETAQALANLVLCNTCLGQKKKPQKTTTLPYKDE